MFFRVGVRRSGGYSNEDGSRSLLCVTVEFSTRIGLHCFKSHVPICICLLRIYAVCGIRRPHRKRVLIFAHPYKTDIFVSAT